MSQKVFHLIRGPLFLSLLPSWVIATNNANSQPFDALGASQVLVQEFGKLDPSLSFLGGAVASLPSEQKSRAEKREIIVSIEVYDADADWINKFKRLNVHVLDEVTPVRSPKNRVVHHITIPIKNLKFLLQDSKVRRMTLMKSDLPYGLFPQLLLTELGLKSDRQLLSHVLEIKGYPEFLGRPLLTYLEMALHLNDDVLSEALDQKIDVLMPLGPGHIRQLRRDLGLALEEVVELSNGKESPEAHILLPIRHLLLVATHRLIPNVTSIGWLSHWYKVFQETRGQNEYDTRRVIQPPRPIQPQGLRAFHAKNKSQYEAMITFEKPLFTTIRWLLSSGKLDSELAFVLGGLYGKGNIDGLKAFPLAVKSTPNSLKKLENFINQAGFGLTSHEGASVLISLDLGQLPHLLTYSGLSIHRIFVNNKTICERRIARKM
jgi:hypothetical protein